MRKLPEGRSDKPGYYRPELDALRFFAFLSVFVHHALQHQSAALVLGKGRAATVLEDVAQAGNFGMSLFFVLSAYLITQLLLLEVDRTGTLQVKAFYWRRILRIWPLYFFFLAVCVGLSLLFPEWMQISVGRATAFVLLSANWYLIFHPFMPFEIGILWSISVEEQFYLVWPAAVLLGGGRRGIHIASALFAVGALGTLLWLGHVGANGLHVWLNSVVEFLFFAAGAELALLTSWRLPALNMAQRALGIGAGLAMWIVAVHTHFMREPSVVQHTATLLGGYAATLAGTAMIFLAVLGTPAQFVPNWLRYLGKISYGLYVYHMMMITLAMWSLAWLAHAFGLHGTWLACIKVAVPLTALGFTLVAAAASYRLLESPFLKLRKRFTVVASRPI